MTQGNKNAAYPTPEPLHPAMPGSDFPRGSVAWKRASSSGAPAG